MFRLKGARAVRKILAKIVKPHGRASFLYHVSELFQKPSILDVGCGNDAILTVKRAIPSFHYTRLDVGIYNMSSLILDEFIIVTPSAFADKIGEMADRFDVVISAHNLEHCFERGKTFINILKALKKAVCSIFHVRLKKVSISQADVEL
ncbi:MAG: hypothetical protein LBD73_00820 [Deferribacteraceae bacterium]|jgi:2-polyprenyl-3-methyl-5-hydroxy-6-metoxy-1,4-benzoquinol methylase|nr:hypothetical protein [Deferribacteraceae bacterium]